MVMKGSDRHHRLGRLGAPEDVGAGVSVRVDKNALGWGQGAGRIEPRCREQELADVVQLGRGAQNFGVGQIASRIAAGDPGRKCKGNLGRALECA